MRNRRHKLWIDRFQTSLSIRIALYFVFFYRAHIHPGTRHYPPLPGSGGSGSVGILGPDRSLHAHVDGRVVYSRRDCIHASDRRPALPVPQGDSSHHRRGRTGTHSLAEGRSPAGIQDEFNQMLQILEQRGAIQLKTSEAAEPAPPPRFEVLLAKLRSPEGAGKSRGPRARRWRPILHDSGVRALDFRGHGCHGRVRRMHYGAPGAPRSPEQLPGTCRSSPE